MKLWRSKSRAKGKLGRARDALYAMSVVGYDMVEDLGSVEGWLDGVTSTLAELAELDPEPDTLEVIIDEVSSRPEFSSLVAVRDEVRRLYEYASCIAYGVSTLDDEELRGAGGCFQDVHCAIEEVLAELEATAKGRK